MTTKIAYQGEAGSNSHIACRKFFPEYQPLPCKTFEEALESVEQGENDLAMIPIDNSIAGRVGDIHHLLPKMKLHIIGERFLRIRFQLMAVHSAKLEGIKHAYSHVMALEQCRNFLSDHSIQGLTAADTAGAARFVSESNDATIAAIAPLLASEVYNLKVLEHDIEDAEHNTTRFLIMSRSPLDFDPASAPTVTAFVFQVRNIPASLYKSLGGFATNGVNMTKLESYMIDGSFSATRFYAEVEGHPDQRPVQLALEELGFFSDSLKVLGVFPAGDRRITKEA